MEIYGRKGKVEPERPGRMLLPWSRLEMVEGAG